MAEKYDRGITVKEAAHRIGCDESHIRDLLHVTGGLTGYYDGRRLRVHLSSVLAYQMAEPIVPKAAKRGEPAPVPKAKLGAEYREAIAYLGKLGLLKGRRR